MPAGGSGDPAARTPAAMKARKRSGGPSQFQRETNCGGLCATGPKGTSVADPRAYGCKKVRAGRTTLSEGGSNRCRMPRTIRTDSSRPAAGDSHRAVETPGRLRQSLFDADHAKIPESRWGALCAVWARQLKRAGERLNSTGSRIHGRPATSWTPVRRIPMRPRRSPCRVLISLISLFAFC